MNHLRLTVEVTKVLLALLLAAGCSSSDPGTANSSMGGAGLASSGGTTALGGATNNSAGGASTNVVGAQSTGGNASLGGSSNGGSALTGGTNSTTSGTSSTAGSSVGGATNGGSSATGGKATGGGGNLGGAATGGKATTGGFNSTGGAAAGGNATTGGTSNVGGAATGGNATSGGASNRGGAATGGNAATGGAAAASGTPGNSTYPCDGTTTGYNATMIKSGSTWTVTNGTQRYSGSATQSALEAAYGSLTTGRTSKQSILVQGDGDIPASSQVAMPSYTILNWCGTLNVSGTPSGSDRSPLYARGRTDIEIPNLKMTGSPQYGIFFRGTNNMHLGRIDLQLTASAGIGIRVDTSGSASTDTTFVTNLTIDYVTGGGMGSQLVETYGVDQIKIGTIEGDGVGECGLLFNRSINAEVDLVTCNNCGTGTGYAAFRVANNNGKIGSDYPAGNIHVKKVVARGGARGIFSVSSCGGLTIDSIDIANVGSTPILLQNTYNTTIAAASGTVVGGVITISNDKANTDPTDTRIPMVTTRNVKIQNLNLSGGASVKEDWCDWKSQGDVGNRAINVTGGTVSMCY